MRSMSRRTLLGAGGVAVVGAGAVAVGERERGRRWLHSMGIVKGPDLDPPDLTVPVEAHQLVSQRMGRTVDWAMAMPDARPTALLVCLHGRDASHRFAFDTIGVHRFVRGAKLTWAVASVDGGVSSYWHARSDGTDAQAMVFEELLPALRRSTGDVPLLLLGWSMGGYGALLAASDHPNDVHAVAATSPALWRSFAQSAPGAFDSDEDYTAHDLFSREDVLRRSSVRIDCGRDDPFAANARKLAIDVADESDFGSGFHDPAYWRSRVPSQLTFLRRAIGR
jgi:pimeloyl-ACP methyl ester carboxylesterase